MLVTLFKNGEFENEIIGSIVDSVKISSEKVKLMDIAIAPSLQMIEVLTITEKGYNLKAPNGKFFKVIQEDFENGPENAKHVMSILTSLLYARFKNGKTLLVL